MSGRRRKATPPKGGKIPKHKFSICPTLKTFEKDPKKTYLRKFRIYPAFLYGRLDRWLHEMSLAGWHVVDSSPIAFLFERGEAQHKVYFTYTWTISRQDTGFYSISLRYPLLEETYGVKKKRSKLNKNEAKAYRTIEIDTDKIDVEHDIGYLELLSDRDRLYRKRAIQNGVIIAVFLVLLIILEVIKRFS